MNIESGLRKSAQYTRKEIWPKVGPFLGGGSYEPCEGSQDPVARMLDVEAGIDGFQRLPNGAGLRGAAVRLEWKQNKDRERLTFTYELANGSRDTQLGKAVALARDPDSLKPHYLIHGFIGKDGQPLAIYVVSWSEAVLATQQLWETLEKGENRKTKNKFVSLPIKSIPRVEWRAQ